MDVGDDCYHIKFLSTFGAGAEPELIGEFS